MLLWMVVFRLGNPKMAVSDSQTVLDACPAQKMQTSFQFYEPVLQGVVRPVLQEVL